MARKKGGAKNKLARMSEEERARYLQHRADMEEEARRRKQQLIALYMKNKLKREEAFSRLNLAKINQEWRSILRQIKNQELKKEVQEIERLFHESLEQKSRIIQRYLNDLDEAEEIYANLSQSQMENVDKIIDLQNERMDYFKDRYIEEKELILQECQEDFESYKQARTKAHIQLECVYFALDDQGEKTIHEMDENHLDKMDILRSVMTIKLEEITKSREEQIEMLWKEYQKILDDYVKYTESFYAEYNELRERDEINTQLIRSHCYEVAKATDEMAELKIIADNTVEESEFQIQYLEKYRNSLNEKFFNMKKDLEDKIKSDEDEFRHMSVASHETIQTLEKILKKVQMVLQLAGVCRRLETEREKVLPFGHSKKDAFERPSITDDMKSPPIEIKDKILENWYSLENFWIRVNKVRLDTACLQEEKTFLENENEQLKIQLKNYLIQVTIATGSNGIMDERLKFRPNSMKVEKVVHIELNKPATAMVQGREYSVKRRLKRRPVTCIEANLSNAVRSNKIAENRMSTVRYSYGKIGNVVNSW